MRMQPCLIRQCSRAGCAVGARLVMGLGSAAVVEESFTAFVDVHYIPLAK